VNDSNEACLLLAASHPRPDQSVIERMRGRISAGVNWSEFLRLAIPHGLLPLVARNLAAYAVDVVPAATVAQLGVYRKRVEDRNRKQVAALSRVVGMLSNEGIRALPFKGPLLAAEEYGDVSLRESHDLDLWVHPGDIAAAGKVLRAAGYCGIAHHGGVPRILAPDRGDYQTEFVSANGEVLLEVQGELQQAQYSFLPDFDEVWERRQEVLFERIRVPYFSPEDLLLLLAVHGSKHIWRRLSWVADIAALIDAHPGFDWKATIARSKRWRCRRRLFSAALLVESLYHVELPKYVRDECRRHWYTRSSVARVRNNIIGGYRTRTVGNFISELRNHILNADTSVDRLRIAVSHSKKIVRVEETEMIRSMSPATFLLFRISRGVRMVMGKFVTQD